MTKKYLALAVAGLGFSGAVLAQSNVTLYGVADVAVESANSGYGRQLRVQSGQLSGSRIGFKGDEDLGDDLRAFWVLEAGLDISTGQSTCHSSTANSCTGANAAVPGNGVNSYPNGTSSIFGRQAFAGLKGQWGSLSLGRQYQLAYPVKVNADAYSFGTVGTLQNAFGNIAAFNPDRLDNAIVYASPVVSGWTLNAAYSTGQENNINTNTNTATPTVAGQGYGLSAVYKNGPIDLGLVYQSAKGTSAAGLLEPAKSTGWLLGGAYDLGVAKAFAAYASGKTAQATTAGVSSSTADGRAYNLGVRVPVARALSLVGQFSRFDDRTAARNDFSLYSVGYLYDLSKRSTLYGAYAKGNNHNSAAVRLNGSVSAGLNPIPGFDPSALQLGFRHTF